MSNSCNCRTKHIQLSQQTAKGAFNVKSADFCYENMKKKIDLHAINLSLGMSVLIE